MNHTELPLEKRLWLAEQDEADLRRRADAALALWEAKCAEVARLRAELAPLVEPVPELPDGGKDADSYKLNPGGRNA